MYRLRDLPESVAVGGSHTDFSTPIVVCSFAPESSLESVTIRQATVTVGTPSNEICRVCCNGVIGVYRESRCIPGLQKVELVIQQPV